MEDETVFRTLADPSCRRLLDLLFERDCRAFTELESQLPITRFGVMKRLRVLFDLRRSFQPKSVSGGFYEPI